MSWRLWSRNGAAVSSARRKPAASPFPLRRTLLVFLIALAILTLIGLDYRDDPFFQTHVSDPASYDSWARRIAGGGLAGEPAFHQSPLFPLALARVYDAVPEESARTAALVFQSILLAVAIALLVPIGRALFDNDTAGLAASVVALAYAPLAFHSLKLLPVAIALATQALALWLVLRLRMCTTPWRAGMAGLAVGLACVARAEILLFVPLAVVVFRPVRGRVASLLVFLAGVALAIAPVTAHNVRRGEFTLIASSGGENLFIGNQRGGDGGHRALDPRAGDLASQRVLARKIAEEARGEPLSGREVSAYWRGRAWSEIRAAPGAWLALEGRKLARWVSPRDPTDLFSLALERRTYVPSLFALGLPTLGLWLLAVLGAIGLRRRDFGAAWPLFGLLGVHAMALMTFFVSTRLRLPFLFWLCPLAGLAVASGVARWRAGRRGAVIGLVVLLVAIAAADLRLQQPGDRERLRLSSVLSMRQRLDESLEALAPALRRAEPDGLLLDQAGWVSFKKGEMDAALSYYRRALETGLPGSREQQTRSRLAGVLERMNRFDQAAAEHQRSIDVDPEEAGAWFERAKFRMRRSDRDGAIADLREANRLRPDWNAAREALENLTRAD